MPRFSLVLILLATLVLPTPVAAQAGCSYKSGFALLQTQMPDVVGSCRSNEIYRPEIGESSQLTAKGILIWHSVDNVMSFSDGYNVWVLDPGGQVQLRGVTERFAFEFNGDGYPLAGQPAPEVNGPCPTAPVAVLAVENFYGNLVQQLGGQCVSVTTILSDPSADPHEFQPTANDMRAFQGAVLVVANGLGYDDFADKAIATMSRKPQVVRAGDVVGLQRGANPHVWYSAGYVEQINAAILANLKQVNPDAGAYYDNQAVWLDQAFGAYRGLLSDIATGYGNTPIGATESIFVFMSTSAGLKLISPNEFMTAISEGNDPSARDIAEFQNQVKSKQIKLLVYNVQTVTPTTDQLKDMAVKANIPIVGVTETMPLGSQTFQGWQALQLRLLLNALQQATS
jgi:zinc/manganese transport system substrate-binding protein